MSFINRSASAEPCPEVWRMNHRSDHPGNAVVRPVIVGLGPWEAYDL